MSFDTFNVQSSIEVSDSDSLTWGVTRREGFDSEQIEILALSVLRAKATKNCYLISVLGAFKEEPDCHVRYCTQAAGHPRS
jgi:hypothetical protein